MLLFSGGQQVFSKQESSAQRKRHVEDDEKSWIKGKKKRRGVR
jgi:hypothetical protein